MKHSFVATLGEGREIEVAIEPLGSGRYRYHRGDVTFVFDARRTPVRAGTVAWSIVREDTRRADFVEIGVHNGSYEVQVDGHVISAQLVDARKKRAARAAARPGTTGPAEVRSPMPGKVVKLLVGVGESVNAGQGVIVVEAMKMENELRATRAGAVAAILVKEGQAVDAGEVMLRLDAPQ